MSYRTLPHLVRGLVFTLLILLLAVVQAQDGDSPAPPESPILESLEEADVVEADTDLVTHPIETHVLQESVAPPIRFEPPPPQVIQVQLPTMPVLAREDIELLVGRLTAIEQRLVEQQTNTTAMLLRSNQSVLTVAAILGGFGLFGILGAAIVLVRAFNRFSDVMLTLPMGQQLGHGMSLNALAMDDLHPASANTLEQVSARFLGALEQLEKRVRELEVEPAVLNASTTTPLPGNGNVKTNIVTPPANTLSSTGAEMPLSVPGAVASSESNPDKETEDRRRILKLLEEGESLLHGDNYEDALGRFEEALAIDPRNSEALIKRGMTLERLQRMDAALESYDRAIATNGSLTLAYLHKGAICNRLQRYREALECYERALQAEQKS
jgi:hypothetical protein